MMFVQTFFMDMRQACEYIKRILAELPKDMEYEVIHSIASDSCKEDGGEWEDIGDIVLDYLRDLDAQQGVMIFDPGEDAACWDWVEAEKENMDHCSAQEVFVEAGEGVVVYHDTDAVAAETIPVYVMKKSFCDQMKGLVEDFLREPSPKDFDVTSKISPAVYVELFDVCDK